MSKLQIVLVVSIAFNVVLAWIILSPSTDVKEDHGLTDYLIEENAQLKAQDSTRQIKLDSIASLIDSANKKDTIIQTKYITRYETIYAIPDSFIIDSVAHVLDRFQPMSN